jgi:hypothetical protein
MRSLLKNFVSVLAPDAFIAIQSIRSRRLSHRLFREWGVLELNQRLRERFGSEVVDGPFKGIKLTDDAFLEQAGPYLLGTYEQELHPWIYELLKGKFSEVWDIGSKFGYYAVGFARTMPNTKVLAFDTDWWARRATSRMAMANSLVNVEFHKACKPATITTRLPANALIISDCEGYERHLFADMNNSALDSATLLIETHDLFVPGVTNFLKQRFCSSHEIDQIANGERTTKADLQFIESSQQPLATTEVREQQLWLLLTPKRR